MMKTERPGWWMYGVATVAVLLLLVSAYVGCYFALVQPEPTLVDVGFAMHPVTIIFPRYPRFAGVDWDWFFRPIHSIDRRLRPNTWLPPP
jgi:hypothetical protein